MCSNRDRARIAVWLAALALACIPVSAGAGGGPGESTGERTPGTHFFGDAKDIKGMSPLEGVTVKIRIAGTRLLLLVLTGPEGGFRLEGFGRTVNADKVDVTCSKPGYRMIRALRQRVPGGSDAPIEIECLMVHEGT